MAVERIDLERMSSGKRFLIAFAVYAALAAVAWTTLPDQKFRYATLAILAMFALRTWSWRRKLERDEQEDCDHD